MGQTKSRRKPQETAMTTTPPPDDPAWAHVRARYEQKHESVEQIASSIGLAKITLSNMARRLGWQMRGAKVATTAEAPKPARKSDSTTATIKRLKEMLQQRVTQLEEQLKDIGAEVSALSTERDIRATNTLVRTIEKVLDLERKDRQRHLRKAREFKYFDEQQRAALADKIERLQREWRGPETVNGAAPDGSDGTEQPVALLGQAGKAAAT
jgi:hypothetical protein